MELGLPVLTVGQYQLAYNALSFRDCSDGCRRVFLYPGASYCR